MIDLVLIINRESISSISSCGDVAIVDAVVIAVDAIVSVEVLKFKGAGVYEKL